MSDNFGRSVRNAISVTVTLTTVSIVGGWPFIIAVIILGMLYWNGKCIPTWLFGQALIDYQCQKSTDNVVATCVGLVSVFGLFDSTYLWIDIHLDSVSRSPLYSMYGETIAGVPVIRAFGAGSKFLRDMMSCVDTVSLVVRFRLTLLTLY